MLRLRHLLDQILSYWRAVARRRFRTLKSRLMLLITAALVVVVGLPVALFVYQLDRNYYEFSTDMLEISSNVVFEKIHAGMIGDPSSIDSRLEEMALDTPIRHIRVYRPNGEIVFSSTAEERGENVFTLPRSNTVFGDEDVLNTFARYGDVYSHHHPMYVRDDCVGCHENRGELIGILDVQARTPQSEQIYTYAKNLSVTGGILIVVILILVTNIVYESQVEHRLKKLLTGFDELASGNPNPKVSMQGEHELAQLAERFNFTVEKLREAREKEDEFYREKLEHADRLVTLGEIAAEIAHEVNNPAGIILTRAELLRDDLVDGNGDAAKRDDLDIIVQQTERISEITRSILHYAHKRPRAFADTNLGDVIRRAIKVMSPIIKKRDAVVLLDLPDEQALIRGSAVQLEQVFCNLVNNSLDAVSGSSVGNEIRIGLRRDPADRASWVVIFHDNGPGIPPEFAEEVFTPFFTTKRNGNGTGLGLFIVRNIIANHGGTIQLEPVSEGGARFKIVLMSVELLSGEAAVAEATNHV